MTLSHATLLILAMVASSNGFYLSDPSSLMCGKCFEPWQTTTTCNAVYRNEGGECGTNGVKCKYRTRKDPGSIEYGCLSQTCLGRPTSSCEVCTLSSPQACNTGVTCEFEPGSAAVSLKCQLTAEDSPWRFIFTQVGSATDTPPFGAIELEAGASVSNQEQFAFGSLNALILYGQDADICIEYEFTLASDVVLYMAIMDEGIGDPHKREIMRQFIADFQANGNGFLADDGRTVKLIGVHTSGDATPHKLALTLHFSSVVPVFAMVPTSGVVTDGESKITKFTTDCTFPAPT